MNTNECSFKQALVAIAACLISLSVFAQSLPKKKKIKDFGSSLKRLKWDEKKKAAVFRDAQEDGSELNEGDVIRIETSLVTCDVLVIDTQGKVITGLKPTDFVVSEDNQPQTLAHFVLGDDANVPRTIVLIIDYSPSQFPYLRNSVDAAKLMVDKLGPLDRMAIVTDDVEVLVNFTEDKKKLKASLEMLIQRTRGEAAFPHFDGKFRVGKSQQYSALFATLNDVFSEEDQRPIIIFQTDGDEIDYLRDTPIVPSVAPDLPPSLRKEAISESEKRRKAIMKHKREFGLSDVYRMAERSRATIYTVVPGFRLIGFDGEQQLERMRMQLEYETASFVKRFPESESETRKRNEELRTFSPANLAFRAKQTLIVQTALAAMAPLTGGWTEFLEKREQADAIYSRIFSDINQRYILGYYPTNKERDGERRSIKITVREHPEYIVLGRTAYYAPEQ